MHHTHRVAGPFLCALALALTATSPDARQAPAARLTPGDYVTERGWGHLTLTAGGGGTLAFRIETVGGNAHTCSLDGSLRDGTATLEGNDEKTPCTITMKPTARGHEVSSKGCSLYCGMRAMFDGLYLRPPPGCRGVDVEASRRKFKRQYDAKAFADARATLEPVLNTCGPVLDWLTIAWVRNDVAVTRHKLGDFAGCRTVLEPLAADAALTDAGLLERYPPTDAEMYLPIVRATRTNLRLCRDK